MTVRSKLERRCVYISVLVWTRSRLPKPVSQFSPLCVLHFDLGSGSGRDEPKAFQMKHTLENMLREPSWCTACTNTYSVHAMIQVARHSHGTVAEGPEF